MVRTLAPTKNDAVLEIGPGTGKLTKFLLEYSGRVMAVEKDPDMIEALRQNFRGIDNLEIVHADILEADIPSLLGASRPMDHASWLFAGNLPYNISTPILFKLRDNRKSFRRGIIMIQKEVAMRLTARPGNKDYGILSIMMQIDALIERCFDVSPGSFIPPPKVTSSVVKIEFPQRPPYHIENKALFERLVKTIFGTRRKMIRNSIPKGLVHCLEEAGIDPTSRPEEISIDDFARLTLRLSNKGHY